MNMVDDATGDTNCRMGEQETIWAAAGGTAIVGLRSMEFPGRCTRIGRTSISGSPQKEKRLQGKASTTQFGGMCERLEIRIIAANSPQAKGRVERNKRGTSRSPGKEAAAQGDPGLRSRECVLEAEYLPEHNRRFAREAARPEDYHVRTPSAARLSRGFSIRDGTMDQQRLGGAVPRAFFCSSSRRIGGTGRHGARP